MNEKQKLAEAKYFLQHMENEQNSRDNFKYETSAFLAASRSVLYYAYKETKGTHWREWLNKRIGDMPIFEQFSIIRNENIHDEPMFMPIIGIGYIEITANATISAQAEVLRKGEVVAENQGEKDRVLLENIEIVTPNPHDEKKDEIYNIYFFKNTDKSKNVLELCHEYLNELEGLVEEGIKRGALTG